MLLVAARTVWGSGGEVPVECGGAKSGAAEPQTLAKPTNSGTNSIPELEVLGKVALEGC